MLSRLYISSCLQRQGQTASVLQLTTAGIHLGGLRWLLPTLIKLASINCSWQILLSLVQQLCTSNGT
jgi:hypothetical protein